MITIACENGFPCQHKSSFGKWVKVNSFEVTARTLKAAFKEIAETERRNSLGGLQVRVIDPEMAEKYNKYSFKMVMG